MTYNPFTSLVAAAALLGTVGLTGMASADNSGQDRNGPPACPETVGAFPGDASTDFRGPPDNPGNSGRTPPGQDVRAAALCGVGALPQDGTRRRGPPR